MNHVPRPSFRISSPLARVKVSSRINVVSSMWPTGVTFMASPLALPPPSHTVRVPATRVALPRRASLTRHGLAYVFGDRSRKRDVAAVCEADVDSAGGCSEVLL